tara:strand:+ start:362 stop:1066 length:705 start_codon:yes stop_codon:yes gene_type:complete
MVNLKEQIKLSIIIPTFNEAERLTLLLADLGRIEPPIEIIISDAQSKDSTELITKIAGAQYLECQEANRGRQLHDGASSCKGDWILFIHADSRLSFKSLRRLNNIITNKKCIDKCYFFNLKIKGKGILFRLLEMAIMFRSNILGIPYGDQALLIRKEFYKKIGGYKPLYLMEDLDIIERIKPVMNIKSTGTDIFTDSRRWKNCSVISKSISNYKLRRRWRRGESSKNLFREYYY